MPSQSQIGLSFDIADSGEMSIEELDDYIDMKMDQITRKIVLDLFTMLVRWTPVDTGRARAGWSISKGVPSRRVPPDMEYFDDPRPNRIVYKAQKLSIWYIVNNVEYIEVLDDGRSIRDGQMRGSEQAPNGMTTSALAEIERALS